MIALVASAMILATGNGPATAQQAQQPQTLLQQIIPNPTGRNGYEEYLMACDVVRAGRNKWLFQATPEQFEETIAAFETPPPKGISQDLLEEWKMERPSPEAYQQAKKYRSFSVLQLRREALVGVERALDLVNRGNKKPVFDPRTSPTPDTLYPDYAEMKALAKLAVTGAYVAFAEGRSKQGTQYLCDAIILGQNISDGVLIARLVGVAIQAIALAAIEKHLPSLSAIDARQLEALAPRLIHDPPIALRSIDREFRFLESSLEAIVTPPGENDQLFDVDEATSVAAESARKFLKNISPVQKQLFLDQCRKKLRGHRELLLASYRRPESQWDIGIELESDGFDPKRKVESVQDAVEYVSDTLTPVFSQVGAVEVKNRTQIRLLGLVGLVIRYRWEHDRWPSKLADAAGANAVRDPASGDEFVYELQENGFRVVSKGTKTLGEIALRYRRPSTGGPDVLPPP